jgi:hypothetical protein
VGSLRGEVLSSVKVLSSVRKLLSGQMLQYLCCRLMSLFDPIILDGKNNNALFVVIKMSQLFSQKTKN